MSIVRHVRHRAPRSGGAASDLQVCRGGVRYVASGAEQHAPHPQKYGYTDVSSQVSDVHPTQLGQCATSAPHPVAQPLTCGNAVAPQTDKSPNRCAATEFGCATACPYGACAHTRAPARTPARIGAREAGVKTCPQTTSSSSCAESSCTTSGDQGITPRKEQGMSDHAENSDVLELFGGGANAIDLDAIRARWEAARSIPEPCWPPESPGMRQRAEPNQ